MQTIMLEVRTILTSYVIHAATHLTHPGVCMQELIESSAVDMLYMEIYAPVTDAMSRIDGISKHARIKAIQMFSL